MQTQGGTDAENAILSNTRRFHVELVVDWNGDGLFNHSLSDLSMYADDIVTDRALKGSAPEDILLVEGSSAAELSFDISGRINDMDFTAIFSPYNGLSPLYTKNVVGAEVKYSIGIETVVGRVWYPQFVGNIGSVESDRASGVVTIQALDRVEKLRKPIILTHWAISQFSQSRGKTLAQLADSASVIDNCLRLCNVSQTKYRPTTRLEMGVPDGSIDGINFWLNGTGGHVPVVGWMDNANEVTYRFPTTETTGVPMYRTNGTVHPALTGTDATRRVQALSAMESNLTDSKLPYWISDRTQQRLRGTHYFGMILNTDTSVTGGSWHLTMPDTEVFTVRIGFLRKAKLMLGNNQFWFRLTNEVTNTNFDTAKVTIPSGQLSVELYAKLFINVGTPTMAMVRAGANQTTWASITSAYAGDEPTDLLTGVCEVWHTTSLNDIGYAFRNVTSGSALEEDNLRRQATYAAVLDNGANTFSFMPKRDGVDAWDIITEVAAAEFGSVLWDEAGVFRFWNLQTVINKQNTVVREINLSNTSDLKITNTLDSVRNVWSVTANKKRSAQIKIYESRNIDEFFIPTGQSRSFVLFVDDVQQVEPRNMTRCTTNPDWYQYWPAWNDNVQHGYCFQILSGDWHEPYEYRTYDWTWNLDRNGNLVCTIYNGYLDDVRFSTPGGQPAFRIQGTEMLTDSDAIFQNKDTSSIAKFGERNYAASGDWYQEFYNLEGLMGSVLPRTIKPIPTTDSIEIAGDPRLQLADTVLLRDAEGLGEEMKLQVYGISRRMSKANGLTDRLTVEMIKPPGTGIWDSSQYGRWDQSLIWSD
jgi:hypothetical protein